MGAILSICAFKLHISKIQAEPEICEYFGYLPNVKSRLLTPIFQSSINNRLHSTSCQAALFMSIYIWSSESYIDHPPNFFFFLTIKIFIADTQLVLTLSLSYGFIFIMCQVSYYFYFIVTIILCCFYRGNWLNLSSVHLENIS